MPSKQLEILLVEDNPTDAILLQETIAETKGNFLNVTAVDCLAKAISNLKDTHYDAMLLDLSLPDSNGITTVKKIRDHVPDIPVVVLTGTDDERIGIDAIRRGAQDYLIKGQVDGRLISRAINYAIERKIAQQERDFTIELLKLVNSSREVDDAIKAAVSFFKEKIGCKAAGIRFKKDNDYPFYHAKGFSEQFIASENSLVVHNKKGKTTLRCICGSVISGKIDTDKSYFTSNGTFWTNNASKLFTTTSPSEFEGVMDRFCCEEGFESIVLIPLRAGNEQMGLLQIHDHRKGKFTPEMINLWERMADTFSMALAKMQADEALRKNEELKRIEQEVLVAVERQQRQIGQDLHDSIQGNLAGMNFMLAAIKNKLTKELPATSNLSAQIDNISEAVKKTIAQTRALSRGMSPIELKYGDLSSSLEHLADGTSNIFQTECQFKSDGQVDKLNESTATQLYYICQEAVNNALKHSKCKKIIISLKTDNSNLLLTVEDNGIGIPKEVTFNKGMGTWTMASRAKMAGASFEIRNRKGGGTIIECKLARKEEKSNSDNPQ